MAQAEVRQDKSIRQEMAQKNIDTILPFLPEDKGIRVSGEGRREAVAQGLWEEKREEPRKGDSSPTILPEVGERDPGSRESHSWRCVRKSCTLLTVAQLQKG